jgi:hypothetical protein
VNSQEALEAAARRFHEHQDSDSLDRLGELMQPDAQMTLLVNRLQPVSGRSKILEAIGQGRGALLYRAWVDRFKWLDDATVMVYGQARYAGRPGSWSCSNVRWLDEFRDGLLWRVEAFTSKEAAEEAIARHADSRSLTAAVLA